tara:strand:- start:131 stop:460 length:330 start_codon:yes stop_codon:yes gene_type:complete
MKKFILINTMEYFSLILVLTFIPLHNIYLVFSGIILSLYLINKKYINNLINKVTNILFNYQEIQKESSFDINPNNLDLVDEEHHISLVEKVEESGIIPSTSKDDENIAA